MKPVVLSSHLASHVVDVLGARVEKRNFSAGAWRVVTDEGRQLYTRAPYPVQEAGLPSIAEPLCADTKKGAEELLAVLRKTCAFYVLLAAEEAS